MREPIAVYSTSEFEVYSPHHSANLGAMGGILDEIGEFLEDLFSFLQDVYDELEDFAKDTLSAIESAVRHVVDAVIDFIKASVKMLVAIASFDWDKIDEAFKELGQSFGNLLVHLNPVYFTFELVNDLPLAGSILREIDRFSGGFLTTTTNLNTLFGRALRGDSISKEELMTYAMLGVQIAAVVLTAGTAAAATTGYMSIASSQLAKGTLGETEFGRELLNALAVAGAAYVGGSAVMDATKQYALDRSYSEGVAFASKELEIDSDLEQFMFQGTLMAGGAYVHGNSMSEVLKTYSKQQAKLGATEQVKQELVRHIPSSVADRIAPYLVDSASNTNFSEISLTEIPKDIFKGDGYSFNQFLSDMKDAGANIVEGAVDAVSGVKDVKLKWSDMAKYQDQIEETANSIYKELKRTPQNVSEGLENAAKEGERALNRLKDAVLEAEVDPSLPELDLDIKIPDIKSPDIDLDVDLKDLWDAWGKYDEYFNGKKALYRRRYKGYTIYLLEDGSYYYLKRANYTWWVLGAMAAGTIATTI